MKLARALSIAFLAMPAFAQYAGPAILSRGEVPGAMQSPQLAFRPFAAFSYVYDTGLAGPIGNSQGTFGNVASSGLEFSGGISGTHSWKHTRLGLDYSGSLYHYTKATFYDGTNQTLLLGLTHQLTRHTTLTLRETAGTFSQNFGLVGLSQAVPFDPSMSFIPTTDFFDNRTMYLGTQADFTIQKSARLSFNFGGDGNLVRRRSTSLYGVIGSSARADAQYRLTRRATIGAGYNYTHYGYHRVYGSTDMHSMVGNLSIGITATMEFSGYAGLMRAESEFLQLVPLDPGLAALLGIPTPSVAVRVYNLNNIPNFGARLTRTFRHGVAYAGAGHTMTPGNGLFLASESTSVDVGYAYTGLRRWSLNAQTSYFRGTSLGNLLGTYGSVSGGVTASRRISRYANALASFSLRQYQSPNFSGYNRVMYDLSLGIGFAPGDVPLRVW